MSLPLTVNGKLDARALPEPDYQDGDRYRAPANAVEEILAGIYAQVLGVERVGVDESFFDLGGDSILAMRLVAAINTNLGAGLSVHALFDAPTVAQLAPRLGGEEGGLEPLVARERPAVVPLSFAQSRLWFLDQLQGPSPVYNMATALRISGALDVDALGAALADVVGRHESLRTTLPDIDGVPFQVVVPPERADFGWHIVDTTDWPASQLSEAIEAAARHTFDLATEIPLRATLFRVTDDEHVLVGVMHHIAADGWSITPLVGDLGVAYASRCAGQAPHWAPLAVQYVDYTLWQRDQFGDLDDDHSRIGAQLAYWRDALAGMPERLQLPTDRPYPPIADQRGASAAVDWSAELQQRVRRWPANTTRPASWCSRPPWPCCCPRSAPAMTWQWDSRSPGAETPRSMSWWVFSSTPWCCGSTSPVIPPLRSCWARCGGAAWPPSNIRTCRLRCSSSGSTPPDP